MKNTFLPEPKVNQQPCYNKPWQHLPIMKALRYRFYFGNLLIQTLPAEHPAIRRTGTDVATRDMAVVFRPSMATAGHGLATVAGRMPSLGVLAECCAQAVARVGVARAAREAAHQDLDGLDTNTSVEQLQRWVPQAGPTTGEHEALDEWNFYLKNNCIRC